MPRALLNSFKYKTTGTKIRSHYPHPPIHRSTRNKGVWGSTRSSRLDRTGSRGPKPPSPNCPTELSVWMGVATARSSQMETCHESARNPSYRRNRFGKLGSFLPRPPFHLDLSTRSASPRISPNRLAVAPKSRERGTFQLQRGTLLYHLFIWFDCINWTWSVSIPTANAYFRRETASQATYSAVST